MTRRRITIALHWSNALLVLLLLIAGNTPALTAIFAVTALLWSGIAATRGLSGKPGPKLQGLARTGHIWGHRALYLLIGAAGLAAAGSLLGLQLPFRPLIIALFGASALHAVFHLWRHTVLLDGALRIILPKLLHAIL